MSVRPSFFYAKNIQNIGETGPQVSVFISMASDQILSPASGAGRHGWLAHTHRIAIRRRRCACVGCAGVRASAFARVCVRPFVRDVFAIYDNNI